MAHNARKEDYQRLGLRFAHALDDGDPLDAAREFSSFGRRFAQDRDSLPQSDSDRAFHLVAVATDIVDYQLPFATDEKAAELIARGRQVLDEAVTLDPNCFDAVRMKSSTEAPSIGARYDFLAEKVDEVRDVCERQRDESVATCPGERTSLAADLAMRPYWRWLASMAEGALICGRNRQCIDLCERLLESDPQDSCDVRFTLALALAKLEDDAGLDALIKRYPALRPNRSANDAWIYLARIALAHKRHNLVEAREHVQNLMRNYPNAGMTLIRQCEIPDGEFSRLNVAPYSEDELIIATSEAIVLLQEGNDRSGKGVLGSWLAATAARMDPRGAAQAEAIERQERTGR